MRLPFTVLLGLTGWALVPATRGALQDALVAREVLADMVATCVVRIEYEIPTARPPVFATAFRLEDVLWLYAPEIGTRALGAATGGWPDSATLSARLRRLDPAIRRVTVYPNPIAPLVRQERRYLDNACVIASLNSLAQVLDLNDGITDAGLILMAFDPIDADNSGAYLVNHCVLAYRREGRWWCLDPNQAQRPFLLQTIAVGAPLDPALVALAMQQRYPLQSVHLLAFSPGTLDRVTAQAHWRRLAVSK